MRDLTRLLPESEQVERLSHIASRLKGYTWLCDIRGQGDLTNDAEDLLLYLASREDADASVLYTDKDAEVMHHLQKRFGSRNGRRRRLPKLKLRDARIPLSFSTLKVGDLDTGDEKGHLLFPGFRKHHRERATQEEFRWLVGLARFGYIKSPEYLRISMDMYPAGEGDAASALIHDARCLKSWIDISGRNSMLTEFVIQTSRAGMIVSPYHAHALNEVAIPRDRVIIAKPSVIANRTASLLDRDLRELEAIIAAGSFREQDVQVWLEKHPSFFKAFGYSCIQPQVRLARDDGTYVKPDFMLQPVVSEWWDILDLKRPDVQLIVGERDSRTLASRLQKGISQVREYAAYFENEKYARRIEQMYGIKCYRPKMMLVIGRAPAPEADDRQLRRALTAYDDVRVITFDDLLRIARSRLLI